MINVNSHVGIIGAALESDEGSDLNKERRERKRAKDELKYINIETNV